MFKQELINSILNATENIIYIFDLENRNSIFISDGFERMFGLQVDETGRKDIDVLSPFVHPKDLAMYNRDIVPGFSTLKDKEILTHEYRIQDRAGTWHWLKSKESVYSRHDNGKPKEIFALIRDISEEKLLSDKLVIAKERLEKAEELASMGNWEITVGEPLSKWSAQMFQFFNLPPTTHSPSFKEFIELVHPEDRPIIIAAQQDMKNGILPDSRVYRTDPSALPLRYLMPSYYMERSIDDRPATFRGTLMDITDKVTANNEIEALRLRNDAAVRIGKIGYWVWDIIGEKVYWSDRLYEIYGVEKNHEITYELVMSFTHPEDRNYHEAITKHQVDTKDNSPFEYRIIAADGNIKYLLVQLEIMADENGEVIKLQGTVLDITHPKKAEEATKISEERYRTLVEQATDAIFIADGSGKFTTVNPSASKLSQYTEEELLQLSIYDFSLIADLEREPFHFEDLREGKVVNTERVMRRRDGLQIEVEISAKLLSDGRMLVFVKDISERKKVQNEIIRERNLSDSIINSLPGVFYLYNQQGQFLRWNKNMEKVTGYSAEEISKMHPLDFFAGKEKDLLKQKIGNVFLGNEESVQAFFITKSKEKIPYYFTGNAVEAHSETCLVGVGIDLTNLVEAQEKIKTTTQQLRRLTAHLQDVREEERKRIGREIHDELGQQLTAIKMDVAWMSKKIESEPGLLQNKLQNIIALLDGSNDSVRKILKELRPGILDEFSLPDALEWQAQQFATTSGINVKYQNKGADLKVPVLLATCVFRVCQESLTNIMRYAGATHVFISLELNKNSIKFFITDDGRGFETSTIEHLKSFGILGMKERVISLKGTFVIESSLGNGTTIQLKLPLRQHIKNNIMLKK